VLDPVVAGRPVVDVARDLGISAQSIYSWRQQDRIDKGLEPGLSSGEKAELTAAKRRIAELARSWRSIAEPVNCSGRWCLQRIYEVIAVLAGEGLPVQMATRGDNGGATR
jgi:transposase